MKKRTFIIINVLVLAFAAFSLFLLKIMPGRCLFHDIIHLYCPACGGTRAFYELLSGNIIASIKCNPVPLYLALVFLYYDIRILISYKKKDFLPFGRHYRAVLISIPVFIVLFFLFRNFLLVFYGIDTLGDLAVYW